MVILRCRVVVVSKLKIVACPALHDFIIESLKDQTSYSVSNMNVCKKFQRTENMGSDISIHKISILRQYFKTLLLVTVIRA